MFVKKISKLFFIVIASGILILSLVPVPAPEFGRLSDKVTHLIAYFVLACSFILAFTSRQIHFILLALISVIACTLYGGMIEVLQNFTNRSPELLDFAADLAGSVLGSLIGTVFIMLMQKRKSAEKI